METENSLKKFFQALPSRELSSGDAPIREFISIAKAAGLDALDEKVVDIYLKDYNMIENGIIQLIINLFDVKLDAPYLSRYNRHLSIRKISRGNDTIIFADELFVFTMISFYITIFSLTHNKNLENYKRCIKNCIVLLDLQGIKNIIGTFNNNEFYKMATLPDDIMHLAMDTYWTTWTFVIGHEIFHIINKEKLSPSQEEKEADAFGYKILIQLIQAQKENKVPNELKSFYEHLYLSPMMLIEYYKLLDFYKKLFDIPIQHGNHPDPIQRQEFLFGLFDNYVPDDFDTYYGNELFNNFLETIDLIKREITIKKQLGKLYEINPQGL